MRVSNRRLDNKFNIFEGVTRNWFFMAINVVMVGGQVMIIFVGGKAFNVERLNGAQWAYSIVLGFLSIPIGAFIRLIPDELVVALVPQRFRNRQSKPELTISDEEEQFRFPKPLADVKEELSFLKRVKGGRLNNLKFKMQETRDALMPRSRSGSRSRDSVPQTPDGQPEGDTISSPIASHSPDSRKRRANRSRSNSALGAHAVMAGIIAGSVAGWSPIDRSHGDNESMKFSRSTARSQLDKSEEVEIHPETAPDDPIITENPHDLGAPPSQVPEVTPANVEDKETRPSAPSRESTT
jgi:Ca2+-transporting ATPase